MANEVNGSGAKAGTIEAMGREEFDKREYGVVMTEEEIRWDGTDGCFKKIFEKMGCAVGPCFYERKAGQSHVSMTLYGMQIPQGARLSWRRAIGGDWFVDVYLREGMPALKLPVFPWVKYPQAYEQVFGLSQSYLDNAVLPDFNVSDDRMPGPVVESRPGVEVGVSGSPDSEKIDESGPRVQLRLDARLTRLTDQIWLICSGMQLSAQTTPKRLLVRIKEWEAELGEIARKLRECVVQAQELREEAKNPKISKELGGLVPLVDVVRAVVKQLQRQTLTEPMQHVLIMLEDGLKEQALIDTGNTGTIGIGWVDRAGKANSDAALKIRAGLLDLDLMEERMDALEADFQKTIDLWESQKDKPKHDSYTPDKSIAFIQIELQEFIQDNFDSLAKRWKPDVLFKLNKLRKLNYLFQHALIKKNEKSATVYTDVETATGIARMLDPQVEECRKFSEQLRPHLDAFGVECWSVSPVDEGYFGVILLKPSYVRGEQVPFKAFLAERDESIERLVRTYRITEDASKWSAWVDGESKSFVWAVESKKAKQIEEDLKVLTSLVEALTSERDGWKKEWELMNQLNREVEQDRDQWKKKYDFVIEDRNNWRKDFDRVAKECIECENSRKADMEKLESIGIVPTGIRVADEGPISTTNDLAEDTGGYSSHFIVNCDVFATDILFSVNQSREELVEILSRFVGLEDFDKDTAIDFDKSTTLGHTYMASAGPVIVRLKKWDGSPLMRALMAHEIFHVVEAMLDRIKVRHDIWNTSEVYAYLTQHITQRVYEKLEGNGN